MPLQKGITCDHVSASIQARERLVDLAELSGHISEIAQDQYGSRHRACTLLQRTCTS